MNNAKICDIGLFYLLYCKFIYVYVYNDTFVFSSTKSLDVCVSYFVRVVTS